MKKRDEVSRIDSYNLKQAQSMQCKDILEPEESPSDITAENTFVDVLDEVLGVNWEQPVPSYHPDADEELDKLFEDDERQEKGQNC